MYKLDCQSVVPPDAFPLIVLVFLGESDVCKYIKLLLHDGNLLRSFSKRVFPFENLPDDVLMEKLLLESPEMHFILSCCTF